MKSSHIALRTLSLLLCLILAIGLLAACKTEDAEDTSVASTDASQAPTTTEEPGYVPDSLEDLNFGEEMRLLASDEQKKHFWAAENATTVIEKAIFKRNQTVESRLGIEIVWDLQGSNSETEKSDFIKRIEADAKSGHEIDAVACYNLIPYSLANKGLAVNLAQTQHIDLDGPWWPAEFLEHMLCNDKIFALVSSCGVGTLTNLSGVFFNIDLLEAKGIEAPYTLVKNNQWTIGKLKSLIKDTYVDKNANGVSDIEDIYGLCNSSAARMTCWYYGAGVRFSELNENGELVLTAGDVEKISHVVDTLVDLFSTDTYLYEESSATRYTIFKEERVYFYLSTLTLCTNMVNNNVTVNYGVVPNPKLTTEQSRYYTHIPNSHEAWFIPTGVKNEDASSALLECMASEAYRQLNEVFFETNLKLRYAPDERLAEVYDLIRDSITFDFVYIYKNVFSSNCDNTLLNCLKKPATYQWASSWEKIESSVNTDFEKMLNIYK